MSVLRLTSWPLAVLVVQAEVIVPVGLDRIARRPGFQTTERVMERTTYALHDGTFLPRMNFYVA